MENAFLFLWKFIMTMIYFHKQSKVSHNETVEKGETKTILSPFTSQQSINLTGWTDRKRSSIYKNKCWFNQSLHIFETYKVELIQIRFIVKGRHWKGHNKLLCVFLNQLFTQQDTHEHCDKGGTQETDNTTNQSAVTRTEEEALYWAEGLLATALDCPLKVSLQRKLKFPNYTLELANTKARGK